MDRAGRLREWPLIPQDAMRRAMRGLSYREREVVRLRYGLADGLIYTLEEVGFIFKVTRERIRQVEKRAVQKLDLILNIEP